MRQHADRVKTYTRHHADQVKTQTRQHADRVGTRMRQPAFLTTYVAEMDAVLTDGIKSTSNVL